MQKILIIGATSAIAEATAKLYARRGDRLALLARNRERLGTLAKDLRIRGAESVVIDELDANDIDRHVDVIDHSIKAMGGIDIVVIAFGTLGDQKACERSIELTVREFGTNGIAPISMLTHLANHFEEQGHGIIAVISSVAGDRGRQSNYVYGAAKSAVNIFLQGLRNRLYKAGVRVVTIKPGFVDTPMTAGFKKGILWVKPEVIAAGIVEAIEGRKDIVYLPAFWRVIMFLIKLVPERLFKRLRL